MLIKEQLPCQAGLLHNAALPFRRQCMIPIGPRRVQLLMKLCSCPAPQIMHVGRSNKHRPSLSSTKLYIRTPPAAQTTDVFWRNRDITPPSSHWQGMLFGALSFALFRFCLPCFFGVYASNPVPWLLRLKWPVTPPRPKGPLSCPCPIRNDPRCLCWFFPCRRANLDWQS